VTWSPPTTGGAPASYEIYRSITAGTAFLPDNKLISIPVEAGKSTYTFIDNAGLTAVDTYYWVVSAKNASGETPTPEFALKLKGSGGTGDVGFGNNFSAALIFADDIGITGLALDPSKSWTNVLASIDFNTGLRPLSTEVLPTTTLPYFDPLTAYPDTTTGVIYYKQQTASTWQGQWVRGAGATQQVTAKWGDNLVSQSLSANSTIRIEMVLSEAVSAMTSYTMKSLYGAKANEIQGTDGTTYDNLTAFVFASNARLKIEKLDSIGNTVYTPYDQNLWAGDGPGFLAGEVNVSGNFTYGFVWNLKNQSMPTGIDKTGTWRITFSLDSDNSAAGNPAGSIPLAVNHTAIIAAGNGVLDSATQVHIDINVQ